jgi:hypothetical protein
MSVLPCFSGFLTDKNVRPTLFFRVLDGQECPSYLLWGESGNSVLRVWVWEWWVGLAGPEDGSGELGVCEES